MESVNARLDTEAPFATPRCHAQLTAANVESAAMGFVSALKAFSVPAVLIRSLLVQPIA